MSEQQFAIVFRGRLVAGADPVQVRANFAKLFNIEAARVEQMFAGQPVIIKKGLDLLSADKYKTALAKAGALVDAIDMPLDAAPSAAPVAPESKLTFPVTPAAMSSPIPALAMPVVAEPNVDPVLARSAPPAAQRGTPSALNTTLAEPGVVLVEAPVVKPAAIATEHLSMAAAGARIVDYTPPPAANFELDGLTLAEPGVVLVEPRRTPAAQFDLSGLSLDESARP